MFAADQSQREDGLTGRCCRPCWLWEVISVISHVGRDGEAEWTCLHQGEQLATDI